VVGDQLRNHADVHSSATIVGLIREGVLDAELAALVWLLVEGGLPIHVAAAGERQAAATRVGLGDIAGEVGFIRGHSLEEVLASTAGDPARLGLVLIQGADRVVAAHYLRPPLRDAGGHLHAQGPAVLATWEEALGSFEHFAWGIVPELAERVGRRPGDFEIEHDGRREYLAGLAGAGLVERDEVRAALGGYQGALSRAHRH
jgi:hypothetical protein